jgi:hypothetical protein
MRTTGHPDHSDAAADRRLRPPAPMPRARQPRGQAFASAMGNRRMTQLAQGLLARDPAPKNEQPSAPAPNPVPVTDPAIEGLDLSATAKAAAYQLKAAHPEISFTSGRRSIAGQAHAMASNIVSSGDRQWIVHVPYAGAGELQKWVDDHPAATTVDAIAAGLKGVLDAMSEEQRGKVSKHLSGDAFDVQPQEKDADKIKADMAALPGVTKFLQQEGGLTRWHVQF